MSLTGRGGKDRGQGRKSKGIAGKITVTLTSDELKAYEKDGNSSLVRFLLRNYYGLCTHGIQEQDLATGAKKCLLCGLDEPEDYAKYFQKNREVSDDFPPE